MTFSRIASSASALLVLCACVEDRAQEVRTYSLDHLTSAQAAELVKPYLSREGTVFHATSALNSITVRDKHKNVSRIASVISQRDAAPATVTLHFQVVRASTSGIIDARLESLADALGDLMRFDGYELMSEALVSASERGVVEQSVAGGELPLQLGVQVKDLRGGERSGSAELVVDLRGQGRSLLNTNVVVPMGQTVVLGSAYPGASGEALILTVRAEMGSQKVRVANRRPPPTRATRVGRDVHAAPSHTEVTGTGIGTKSAGGRTRAGGVTAAPTTIGPRSVPAASPPPR